ncbi:insulinase family protein, partial [bacterium]|nr:insulinase family protein [bacterium]
KKQYAPIQGIKRFDIISKESTRKSLEIGFRIPPVNKKEDIKIQALAELINMRLDFSYMKDKLYGAGQSLVFDYEEDNFSEYEAFEYLKQGLARIQMTPPDDFEMECIKNNLNSLLDDDYQNSDYEAQTIASELALNRGEFCDKDIIQNLTSADIIDALKYIDTSNCAISVLHPHTSTNEDLARALNEYQKFTHAVILPKHVQNIDITRHMTASDIKPYSQMPVYSAVLPNNTNLSMVNSKNDTCSVYWNLYNTNTNSYNPAIKYVLAQMYNSMNFDEIYRQQKSGIKAHPVFDYDDGFVFSVSCNKDNIEEAIMMLRKAADIDFNEQDFKKAKEDALSEIRAQKETAADKGAVEKTGISCLRNPQMLEEYLNQLTLNDLRQYYNEILSNSYSFANVIAPFDKNPVLFNRVASALNTPGYQFKPLDNNAFIQLYKQNIQSKVYTSENKTSQPEFEQVYHYKVTSNPDDAVRFALLAHVLDKRIYNDLREKQGLAYEAYAYQAALGDRGKIALKLSSSCNNDGDVQKIFEGFNNNVQRLLYEPVTDSELQEAKDSYKKEVLEFFD